MKKFIILFISIYTCLHPKLNSKELVEGFPPATVSLQLPEKIGSEWKEISRYVNKGYGIIESIPITQTQFNWTDLICIYYAEWSIYQNKSVINSTDNMIKLLRHTSVADYPREIVSWRVIEKNTNDFIYESILYEPYNHVSAQHEIARGFLTESGFHRVGYTKKNRLMNDEEKRTWINILKNNASLVPFQENTKSDELSLVDKVSPSVELASDFAEWQKVINLTFDTGYVRASFLPQSQVGSDYVTECSEIFTMPNCKEARVSDFFEVEKQDIYKNNKKTNKFQVISKSPSEIIYFYSMPHDHLQLNAVVRTLVTDYGHYSMNYRVGLQAMLST